MDRDQRAKKPRPFKIPLVHWAIYHPTQFATSALCVTLPLVAFGLEQYIVSEYRLISGLIVLSMTIVMVYGLMQIIINMVGCTCRQPYKNAILTKPSRIALLAWSFIIYLPFGVIATILSAHSAFPLVALFLSWPYLLFIMLNPGERYESQIRLVMMRSLNRHHLADKSIEELKTLLALARGMLHENNAMVIERQLERKIKAAQGLQRQQNLSE